MSEPKQLNRLSPNRLLLGLNMGLADTLSFIVRISRRGVALKWAILLFAVFFCALIGWWGFLKDGLTKSEALYRSLQLFVLGSGADARGLQLQFARFFAVIVSIYAVLLTLLQCFIDRIRLYLPRLWSSHVIIAGLGSTGIQLVESFKTKNRPRHHVVVIEHDESNVNISTAESYGAIVLCGDASDPLMLKHAGIITARYLICACREDETNLDIAIQASRILDRSFRHETLGNLNAYIHFADMAFYHLLFSHRLFTTRIDRLDIKTFNYFETAARLLMLKYPLDRGKPDWKQGTVHLIIAGFGAMGEALLLQVAKTAHFADASKKTLRVTILDKDESVIQNKSALLLQTLSMEKICDLEFLNKDVENPAVRARMAEWANNNEVTAAIAICLNNEHFSAFCALELSRQVSINVPIFLHITKKRGPARLFAGQCPNADPLKINAGRGAPIIPFGLPEETSTPETLIDKNLDVLARAVYENYQENTGRSVGNWEDLEEWELLSNRAQADHISVKLRAVNCYSAVQPEKSEHRQMHQFSSNEIEIMSRMEHNRWNAERFLSGWKLYTGPTPWGQLSREEQARIKNDLHQSPYLLDWSELSEEIKEYDRNAVKNIFNILGRINHKVFKKKRFNGPSPSMN